MWVDEEIKMSDFDRLHEHLRECVDSDNDSFVGITEDGVEFHMYEFAFGLSVNAKREHDLLAEENRRLTELAAQKASRADELYSRLDKSQMLINSVGLIFMNDTLNAKEKERQLKGLFDVHGDEIYLENRELLDKIKQESNDE